MLWFRLVDWLVVAGSSTAAAVVPVVVAVYFEVRAYYYVVPAISRRKDKRQANGVCLFLSTLDILWWGQPRRTT